MLTGNLLVRGDNLAALRALAPTLSPDGVGQVRCVWIDPPYNTGDARKGAPGGAGYADRRRSEAWLEMMQGRLALLRDTLRPDGSLFVQIDDNEMDALKLALDALFGPEAFIARITVAARSPSSFSTVNKGVFKASEYLLWYARDRAAFRQNTLRVPRPPDPAYALWLDNPDAPPDAWTLSPLRRACPDPARRERFVVEHAARVCRLAVINERKAGRAVAEAKARSLAEPTRVLRLEREGLDPVFLLRGQQVLFYDRQVSRIDGVLTASRPLTNVWTDIPWEGIASEGGVRYKQGKKPERLVRRCLQLATDPGDVVLDAFLGSGTTAAVAHKMGRRWVGIEQGEAFELARARLERVCAGADPTGVTALEGWTGGGDFEARALAR